MLVSVSCRLYMAKVQSEIIGHLLSHLVTGPVLVDVGASGAPPDVWDPIAARATYVGFDPDLREVRETASGHYARSVIINKAITPDPAKADVSFFLTRSPYCSSTLLPDTDSLKDYAYADLFAVQRESTVPATTLNEIARELSLTSIDWLKLDSQGIDLRIFQSLDNTLRSRLLAIDVEPGLLDAYQGEDLFPEVHTSLVNNGFWLSDMVVKGTVRFKRANIERLGETMPPISPRDVQSSLKHAPGWVEARYLRAADWLSRNDLGRREYALLWTFSLLDQQIGFAVDLVLDYRRSFGDDEMAQIMWEESVRLLKKTVRPRRRGNAIRTLLPRPVKRRLRTLLRWMSP